MSRLDQAHARMIAAPDDDVARLRYFETLADTTLYLLLDTDPEGDRIHPKTVTADGIETVLAFDHEERLADFTGEPAPFVELPGRKLAEMLAGSKLALGLNIGVAASETLLPPEAMVWLGDMLGGQGVEQVVGLAGVAPPDRLDPDLEAALEAKLHG
ncbi:MAG: SseB family protein, partial [Rhodobacteraceae bacterium]|nr:SseB family protein [Paracoccaceae bacterium]